MRTLPIRVAPADGEALDSWLEAIAHRTHCAFGDVLSAVGLTGDHEVGTGGWMVRLGRGQASAISEATGISDATIHAMTLTHYGGRALGINADSGTLSRAFPWGRVSGSRFCPVCLEETGGRWQLAWRLGWAFACTTHHCLLADACPSCGAVQRRRIHVGDIIPAPGRCAHPATEATGRAPARCHADLTAAPVAVFDTNHPVMHAARIIDAVLDTEAPTFGVYHTWPQSRVNVLADIRAVAGRALAYGTARELEAVVPADLLAAHRVDDPHVGRRSGPARADAKPGLAAPARAATAAVGVVAALRALDCPDIGSAGDALRWLVTSSRERGLAVRATNIGWGKDTTPVLVGAQLAALGPLLNPSDQLRYRIGTPRPAHPAPGVAASAALARRLPTMLWPGWALRLSIPNCHQRQLRPALAIAALLVNSRLTLDEAVERIDSPIDGHAASRVLQLLEQHDQWDSIRAAVIRVAGYCADHDMGIDYHRRRRLDYATLLPDDAWARICRDTATPGRGSARARIARGHLFEQLTALPVGYAPFAIDTGEFRTKVADFPRHLTPDLAAALDEHGHEFLSARGVRDEPVTWHPPMAMLDDLQLPGRDPAAVDIGELHRLIRVADHTLGATAAHLGITLDTVRYLLTTHPAPTTEPATPDHARVRGAAYRAAKSALSPQRLRDLYEKQGQGLREIAASIGVDRKAIAQLARDYGIALRASGRHTRHHVDRDWLYDQYVTKRRTLPDIAAEVGMSTPNMARWATTHAIPMRARGGPSHSASLAARSAVAEAPELIRPALAGIGGWQRLQRFAAAARYPTLTLAAQELGLNQFGLVDQINRIERELGTKLFIRAERGRPMQLTDHGARVVATVRACQRKSQR